MAPRVHQEQRLAQSIASNLEPVFHLIDQLEIPMTIIPTIQPFLDHQRTYTQVSYRCALMTGRDFVGQFWHKQLP